MGTSPIAARQPGGITVRDFRAGEEADVLAIVRDLQGHEALIYDRAKQAGEIGAWYVDAIKQDVAEHTGRILVGEAGGIVAGYATLLFFDSTKELDEVFYTYAHVGDLGVLASHRGRGIGSALLAACEEVARSAGHKWLRLGVIADNDGAVRLYERTGFRAMFHTMEKALM